MWTVGADPLLGVNHPSRHRHRHLIDAHPALDWSGPGEPDQMNFTPIVPVIAVVYATGFALIAGTVYWVYLALRQRSPRGSR
jgi:hypothetical protein